MRFLHVADTHVGHASFSRVDSRGLNQREQDVFAAFSRVVDLALAERVDFVLHAGDLFDSVRPTNRAVTFVMEEMARSVRGGVPWLVIAGNHESPRLRETGSVLRFLDFVPGVTAAYKGEAETHVVGDCAVHLVPHVPTSEGYLAAVEAVRARDTRWNVLALHAGVHGVDRFGSGEFNEVVLPASALRADADYVALGHYHRHTRVAGHAWYAGSTERTSVKEAAEEKGVMLVDLAVGERRFVPIETRRWLDLPPVDCTGLAEVEIAPAIERALRDVALDDALVRLRVRGMPRPVHAALDHARLRRLGESALHVSLEMEVVDPEDRAQGEDASVGALPVEWDAFVARAPAGPERDDVRRLGLRFLEEATGA
ncbi:MAG TPA: exonuclease SbcCD subunit D [Candidatus Thermoplasmatota archaeon]|nr:exonuclease SbcCD subunit D [Candidatus Thermoplasmatota archaeon]